MLVMMHVMLHVACHKGGVYSRAALNRVNTVIIIYMFIFPTHLQ